MNFQKIELELYDLANLPTRIRKERELKRWRIIMAKKKEPNVSSEHIGILLGLLLGLLLFGGNFKETEGE